MVNVEWSLISRSSQTPAIAPGDLVSAEAGGLPIYEVLDVADGCARLRDQQGRLDRVMPTGALRWRLRPCPDRRDA
jgi:hypothetical protein